MMRRLSPLPLLALLVARGAAGQVIDDALVPSGRVRLEITPSFTSWDHRFGERPDGSYAWESLGADLTSSDALDLFPGGQALTQSLETMSGTSGYAPVLGSTAARVTQEVTRLDIGAHLGLLDWLTVGIVVPRVKTGTALDLVFQPDTLVGDLGLNPTGTDRLAVDAFLADASNAAASARARADQLCAASDPQCAAARALADRAGAFSAAAATAYSATPFFPLSASAIAGSALQALEALDADLTAAGLGAIASPMVFATERVSADAFAELPASAADVRTTALASRSSLWAWGDVEVSALARLLDGEVRDDPTASPKLAYRLLGGVLVRLGTGRAPHPDVPLDVGTGDGQTDIEGRLSGALALGSFQLAAGARYGVQGARTYTRRVAPPEVILAPLSSRHLVRWSPASYLALEAAPSLRLTEELAIRAEYRLFTKGEDSFELAPGETDTAGVDPSVLARESGVTLHQLGFGLTYDTVRPHRSGSDDAPFVQLEGRLLHAFAGRGGQTPVTTRAEFGIRLFRNLWGS